MIKTNKILAFILLTLTGCSFMPEIKEETLNNQYELIDFILRFEKDEISLDQTNINLIELNFEKYIKNTDRKNQNTIVICGYSEVDEHKSLRIKRAQAVLKYLINMGYNNKLIFIKEGSLIFPFEENNRNSLNQRVEIRILRAREIEKSKS